MMNKKGALVLRDMIFMMMIVSAIFVFAGLFVSEMALNYENTNMTNEWALSQTNSLANSTFKHTAGNVSSVGTDLGSTTSGIAQLINSITGALTGIGKGLFMVLTAPNTIADLVRGTLIDARVPFYLAESIRWLIVTILWAVVIFTVYTAFMKGSKV